MLTHITTFLPLQKLTNEQLVSELGRWSADEIFRKTGIHERCVAPAETTATDLASGALTALVHESQTTPDFLILCTQSPDYKVPTSACVLQNAAALPTSCGSIDINLGCSGFIYGLALAEGLLAAGSAKNIALVTSETYTHYLHPKDAVSRPIFGDGAAASLLSANNAKQAGRLHSFVFGTDGAHALKLYIPAGGARSPEYKNVFGENAPLNYETNAPEFLQMNGPEIFNFTLQSVPKLLDSVLAKEGTNFDSIDYFVFHQANAFMLESLRRKMKIPQEKFIVDMASTGNLVSASIPVVLDKMRRRNAFSLAPKRVFLCGFGTGLSWAGCILETDPTNFPYWENKQHR
jgi:3-oxoacyl-[acyl-carrier-protein] synthase-3